MNNNEITNILLIAVITMTALGMFWTTSQIQNIEEKITALNTNTEAKSDINQITPGPKATSSLDGSDQNPDGIQRIQTAILFEKQSSPILSPQTDLTIALNEVSKSPQGIVMVFLTAYTNEAESYSALQPGNVFELVNLSGENQKILGSSGPFDSIPPQSAVTGQIRFKTTPEAKKIILEIDTTEGVKHYEFNFQNRSYEEVILG